MLKSIICMFILYLQFTRARNSAHWPFSPFSCHHVFHLNLLSLNELTRQIRRNWQRCARSPSFLSPRLYPVIPEPESELVINACAACTDVQCAHNYRQARLPPIYRYVFVQLTYTTNYSNLICLKATTTLHTRRTILVNTFFTSK